MSATAKNLPTWAFLISLISNGLLIVTVILLIWRQQDLNSFLGTITNSDQTESNSQTQAIAPPGERYQLNYQQWLDILEQEANVVSNQRPANLVILAGDSLSLWFPVELLPENKNWLNQGISGEKTAGLLKRLSLFDKTRPEAIFVMIGINDLIAGVSDRKILDNQRQIISYLRRVHPKTKIVVQSILPHSQEQATWEGKEKLLAIPNTRIRKLNQELQKITKQQNASFLNLHDLFVNKAGILRPELTTDGLHLNYNGYLVWRTALKYYTQMELLTKK
ncbi:MAG: SGNH/GDSL hydrolase family protein [Mastigocoleus sp.]